MLMAEANQHLQHDWSQVLELVVPYVYNREMHVRLSTVNQHMQHVMQTHIRQHIAAYLKQFLKERYGAWLPSTRAKMKADSTVEELRSKISYWSRSIKWLCNFAAAEAMGTAAAAVAVLSDEFFSIRDLEGTNLPLPQLLVQSGLCLTDDCVVAAVAASKQLRHTRVAEHVTVLLNGTPPERAEQHSGLTPLMTFACTAQKDDPMPPEVLPWAAGMSQQQLYGVLLVLANRGHPHNAAFHLLLEVMLYKQKTPEPASSSSREATPLHQQLVQLLSVCVHRGHDNSCTCEERLVGAILSLPPETHPSPSACLKLLRVAADRSSDAIKHLAALPGVKSLPQEVYNGLLCAHTNSWRLGHALKELLQLPHAQHITSSQLSRLLAQCMDTTLVRFDVVNALLSVPAADAMSSQDSLHVLKVAAAHDARLLAKQSEYINVEESEKVFRAFESLAEDLAEHDAVELFRHVIHYRWHDFIPTLFSCEPLMWQVSPEGLATVITELVTSGLWVNPHISSFVEEDQLAGQVLDSSLVQELEEDHAFAMMQALAELGYSITCVIAKVPSFEHMSCEQVAKLLRLAAANKQPTDVCNLALCHAAIELDAGCILEIVRRLVADWPPGNAYYRLHTECDDLDNRDKALSRLLKLPAAKDIQTEDYIALATTAAKAVCLDGFLVLCKCLPQLREATGEITVALLRPLYQLAIDKGRPEAVQLLLGLSATQQFSTANLQALLLQAIARATRVSSSWDPEDCKYRPEPYKAAMELLKQRDTVIQLLLAAQASRTPTPRDVAELLDACILHGVVSTARALLQEPAGQQMDAGQVEQLLLTYLTQHARQYRKEGDVTQLLGLLLQHPAAAGLTAAAVSRLIVGRGVFAAPATSRKERQRLYGGMLSTRRTSEDGEGADVFDPVELLVGLPAVQQYDAAGLAAVLAAAAEARVSSRVFEVLCTAPAAVELNSAQLMRLLGVCAQHYNAGAFSRLLQHPAAPGRGDSQVQLYAGMLGC